MVAVQIGILIFVVDAVRHLVHAVEQISIKAAKHTEILNALVREVSAGNTDTKRDA